MKLSIRHETVYRYSAPLAYTIQQLRLWPRQESHQQLENWQIHTGEHNTAHCHPFIDAFGNFSHMLTISGAHHAVRIVAEGNINVQALDRGRLGDQGLLSPLVFTVPTRLSEPTASVREFAAAHIAPSAHSEDFLALATAIRGAVDYQSGATEVTSTAADALALGRGVCQDHAHLFLACCHAQRIPARYVSGYIDPGSTDHAESHAWIDVWVEQADFTGWISIDVTHARYASDSYCRLAVARDYESAAPVRGVRRGGGDESLSVRVNVAASGQ